MRIWTVQSHGKSLNIEGESAEFTGMQQCPEVATSGRLTTNKLPGVGLQPPVLELEKRFLRNPTKCSLRLTGLAVRPLYIYLRPPRDEACLPGHSQPGQTTQLQRRLQQRLPRQTLHQPGVQEAAEIKQLLTKGLLSGGRFRNPVERTTGRRETLRTQNKLHRLQKAFVLGLRTWPFSQR